MWSWILISAVLLPIILIFVGMIVGLIEKSQYKKALNQDTTKEVHKNHTKREIYGSKMVELGAKIMLRELLLIMLVFMIGFDVCSGIGLFFK